MVMKTNISDLPKLSYGSEYWGCLMCFAQPWHFQQNCSKETILDTSLHVSAIGFSKTILSMKCQRLEVCLMDRQIHKQVHV
jgi:hypothetical protein